MVEKKEGSPKKERSAEDVAHRSEEAGKGIVVTSAPEMTEAELAGAQTDDEKELVDELKKEIKL